MIGLGPRCIYCKHYDKHNPCRCGAFPKIIPPQIFFSKVEHITPYEGDHGIQFELDPDLSAESLRNYKDRFEKSDR